METTLLIIGIVLFLLVASYAIAMHVYCLDLKTKIEGDEIFKEAQADEIKAKNEQLNDLKKELIVLKNKLKRKDQPRNSKGHFMSEKQKQPDKNILGWKCKNTEYPNFFKKSEVYVQDKTKKTFTDDLFFLISGNNSYLVNKSDFEPVYKNL